jgi:hypothetical protein
MEIHHFAKAACFPAVWLERGLLTGPFFEAQAGEFEREYGIRSPEGGTEHWRYGAFLYWLRRRPASDTLPALVEAALQDPDRPMAGNVLLELVALSNFNQESLELVLARAPSRERLGVDPQRLRSAFSLAHPEASA